MKEKLKEVYPKTKDYVEVVTAMRGDRGRYITVADILSEYFLEKYKDIILKKAKELNKLDKKD
jgi:hypothetical protein